MTSSFSVTLPDKSSVSYTLRGLSEEEVDAWTEFCAEVFSSKENPPSASYFARHYYNDPHRHAELIRVVCDAETGAIVASCRVFVRRISIGNGESVKAGGIGEVCTHEVHRRRGLSKRLLQDAILIMKEQRMQVSLLHAAPQFFPVYQSIKYQNTNTQWASLRLTLTPPTANSEFPIRLARFPQDTPRLHSLHQDFSESIFVGTIIRSEQYWNQYLSKELEGNLFVLTDPQDLIIAWLSIRPRGRGDTDNTFQLQEFGCDRPAVQGLFALHFFSLLCQAHPVPKDTTITLQLPSFVLMNIQRDTLHCKYIDWK